MHVSSHGAGLFMKQVKSPSMIGQRRQRIRAAGHSSTRSFLKVDTNEINIVNAPRT